MYISIIFLPLLAFLISTFFGRVLGSKGTSILTTTFVGFSALLSIIALYDIGIKGNVYYIYLSPWIDSELVKINWSFQFDSLTAIMLFVVNSVSFLVHMYSIGYMSEDPHRPRFMGYLSLFTFFMLILITADNFVQLFLGWEGVGLASYLLINFWYTRLQANKSAIKAMVVNRIGDFGLALGMCSIFYIFHAIDFSTVFALAPYISNQTFLFLNCEINSLDVICLLLFVGAVGKSAQIGLHTWLPDAMEGPTPVSALIHAATMVTAGVFLIARCSPLFEYAPNALVIVTIMGALTAFFAASTGLVQNDLKKVIAYSTCSQLGYMVFACGLSNYSTAIFHLANHAFFKALLFLSAGSVIHAMMDEQDMRKMGGLLKVIPFTYTMILIGSLSLMGFPFLTGFYSKDLILELSFATYSISGTFAHWLGTISAFFTAFYSFRLIYLTFIQKTNSSPLILSHAHDAPLIMAIPLMLLATGSIFIGYLWKDLLVGLGTSFWGASLYILPQHLVLIDSEFIPAFIKLIPVILSLCGAFFSIVLYHKFPAIIFHLQMTTIGREIYIFLNRKWFFDKIYNEFIAYSFLWFGYRISYKTLDKGFIELFGPYGITNTIVEISKRVSLLQSGYLYHYAFVMLIGIVLLLTIILYYDTIAFFVGSNYYLLYIITSLFYLSYCLNINNLKNKK